MEPIAESSDVRPAGLGLPWNELATQLDAKVTLLDWHEWYDFETRHPWPSWIRFPATRTIDSRMTPRSQFTAAGENIQRQSVRVVDPDDDIPAAGHSWSRRAISLLGEGDPLFFLSVVLHRNLLALHREDPIDFLVFPVWGGLGYITQIEAHTTDGPFGSIPIAVVVTSSSRSRAAANQEGEWTRQAIIRNQREDLSLALADVALAFGNRGLELAQSGRLRSSRAPVLAPRHVEPDVLRQLNSVAGSGSSSGPMQFRHAGPADGASGALLLLEAARQVSRLPSPIICDGEDRTFAPMFPRSFHSFWSSRGWVRELVQNGVVSWTVPEPVVPTTGVQLFVGAFSHLGDATPAVAAGNLVLFGPAALDMVQGGSTIPEELVLGVEPTPGLLASRLTSLAALSPRDVERLQSALPAALATSLQGAEWEWRLRQTADAFRAALLTPRSVSLGRVFQRQLDPRRPLSELPDAPTPNDATARQTLSVVVPCYSMGALVEETVESVWQSSRVPDEVIVVDDGSTDEETRVTLSRLARRAEAEGRPLRILRQGNRGLAAARNAGLNAASGTFISFLDGDDLIDPSFYGLALSLLNREPELGGVGAWEDYFGDGAGTWNPPQPELPLLFVENQVFVPCMTRTALLRALGGYDERERYNYEDWELSVRFLARGHPIVNIPRSLEQYRVRGDSMYRALTPVQHQLMRAVMFEKHEAVLASFAREIALQMDHRLADIRFAQASVAERALRSAASRARNVLARATARWRRLTRT